MSEADPSYVRLSGHGVCVTPRPPFALHRVDVEGDGEALEVMVEIGGVESASRVEPAAVTAARSEAFGAVEPGAVAGAWRVEVGGVYAVPWPAGVSVVSAPEPLEPPFFLFRIAAGALVYVQGPFAPGGAPSESALAGAGQTTVARGQRGPARWVELAYEHDGEPWRQRHYLRPFGGGASIAVSTQAREALAPRVHEIADQVVAAIAPYAGT